MYVWVFVFVRFCVYSEWMFITNILRYRGMGGMKQLALHFFRGKAPQ